MNKIVLPERPVIGVQAWRIPFDSAEQDRTAPAVAGAHRYAAASAQPIAVDDAFAAAEDANAMLIIWLPTGEAVPAEIESRAEQWIGRYAHDRPPVRASIRTIRVIWAGLRAIVYAAPDQWPDTLDAVLRFTLIERETTDLERQMPAVWSAVKDHTGLSRSVSFRQSGLLAQLGGLTETVTRMRMSYLHLQSVIEQMDPGLGSASKRLCAELLLAAEIHDRLDVLDEPIQFALDHYEVANTRLIEHRNASTEIFLMGVIIILLLIQTSVMLVQELGRAPPPHPAGPGDAAADQIAPK